MCRDCAHTIHRTRNHYGWDRSIEPVARIAPGETVAFECIDASDGQITKASTVADLGRMDDGRVNPVNGPVYVEGAEPGDALKITIDGFDPSGFGWTANIPGFGLLADQFPDPALHLWSYDREIRQPAAFGAVGKVPLKPFAGTIGCSPAAPGPHSVIPPRRVGGNLDVRDLSAGTVLYLPVEVDGALLSVGDTHAAQGDGEVCGTAIESPMDVALTIDLVKDARLAMPRFTTAGPVTRHLDAKGYEVTTGIGPDLMEGARAAVSGMIDLLSAETGMDPVDAYMLASVCGDLRISEIVDAPNWVVSFHFPRVVLG
ncbi:acetamidase/formamidase family protein [Amorphus coralli]|uniref:acetamidase/formamidase family protein n=1 Tax=Amorphus coralli TaxID=340680 RepID=UPI0003826B5F|nr:acetamidase/formamidase family protein [Amorphus coralli]